MHLMHGSRTRADTMIFWRGVTQLKKANNPPQKSTK